MKANDVLVGIVVAFQRTLQHRQAHFYRLTQDTKINYTYFYVLSISETLDKGVQTTCPASLMQRCRGWIESVTLRTHKWHCSTTYIRSWSEKLNTNTYARARTHTHTTILPPYFRDYPGEPVPEENLLLDFYGVREDNRGRHTTHPAGRHSIQTNQRPTPNIPFFLRQMPWLLQPSHFILAWNRHQICRPGLHTQWHGQIS